MNNVSIQGDAAYIAYRFDFFTFPVLAALVPLVYLGPTVGVQLRILSVYVKRRRSKKREEVMNPAVFFVIVVSQAASFCYMVSDYLTIRLPSTGIMTSWCASQEPNHLLKMLFYPSVYFNYTAMLFPFLLSVLRLLPLYSTARHAMLTARIVRVAVPVIFVYPLLFTFFMIPAVGFCRQLLGPYQFGAIYIFFSGTWFDLKLANVLVLNALFWLSACVVANSLLFSKLKRLRNNRKSSRLRRAELSLSVTTFSMLFSYVTNLVFVIIFIFKPGLSSYFLALRPYGNDVDTVAVPWIFYLTHPVFKRITIQTTSRTATVHTAV